MGEDLASCLAWLANGNGEIPLDRRCGSEIYLPGDVLVLPDSVVNVPSGSQTLTVGVTISAASPVPLVTLTSPLEDMILAERKVILLRKCQSVKDAWDEASSFEVDFSILSAAVGHDKELSFTFEIIVDQYGKQSRTYHVHVERPAVQVITSPNQTESSMSSGAAIGLTAAAAVIVALALTFLMARSRKKLIQETPSNRIEENVRAESVIVEGRSNSNDRNERNAVEVVSELSDGNSIESQHGEIPNQNIHLPVQSCNDSDCEEPITFVSIDRGRSMSFVFPLEERTAMSASESGFDSGSVMSLPDLHKEEVRLDPLDIMMMDRKASKASHRSESGCDFGWTKNLPELDVAQAAIDFDPDVVYPGSPGLLKVQAGERLSILQRGRQWTCVRKLARNVENYRSNTGFIPSTLLDFS